MNHVAFKGSHGTKVASIAAGNRVSGELGGVAPGADLVFVNTVGSGSRSLTAMTELAEAVDYIFRCADEARKPCVVNIGLGDDLGPRDGSSPAERFLDMLIWSKPGRAVTIAAGNANLQGRSRAGHLPSGATREMKFRTSERSPRSFVFEFWFTGGVDVEFEIKAPRDLGSSDVLRVDGLVHWYALGRDRLSVASATRVPTGDKGIIRIELVCPEDAGPAPGFSGGTWSLSNRTLRGPASPPPWSRGKSPCCSRRLARSQHPR